MSIRIKLNDIPAEGREFRFTDPKIWLGPIAEYKMDLRPAKEIEAEIKVVPQAKGAFVRGRITGSVTLPCIRCAEDTEQEISAEFDELEQTDNPESRLNREGDNVYLDVSGLLWEQFVLALPEKPLCREDCRGVCPKCGQNLNQGPCECTWDEIDPRLAVLKNFKPKK